MNFSLYYKIKLIPPFIMFIVDISAISVIE